MKSHQISVSTISGASGSATKALDPDFISMPGMPDPRTEEEAQPLQSWLKDSLEYMANNSAIGVTEARKVCTLISRPGFTQEAGLQVQQALIRCIQQAEATRILQLKKRIADRIHAYPELFIQTSFGSFRAKSFLSSISSSCISRQRLERIDAESEEGVEAWLDLHTLIDRALVDGEKLQQEMRRALRKPGTTEADDQATIAQHLEQFLKGRAGQGNYNMLEAARHLYEMLQDAKDPKRLINLVLQQIATRPNSEAELSNKGPECTSTVVDLGRLKRLTQELFVSYSDSSDSEVVYRILSKMYRLLMLRPEQDKSVDALQQLIEDYKAV